MATSQYTYHPYHTIGAANVLLWDASAGGGSGAWRPLGKVADAAVVVSTEQVGKDLTIKGLSQPIARRNRFKRYSLSFRLLEDANPFTLDLLYSEGASQTKEAAGTVIVSEVVRLYAADFSELAHPFGVKSTPALTVKSYDGVTTYVENTDYVLDLQKGLLRRIAGGGINEGQNVVVGYSYGRPAGIVTGLGDAVDLERYRKVKLLQLAPDDPDPANWEETGLEFEFFKVNVSMNDSGWSFAEEDFSDGASATWDCLYDASEGKVGTVRSTYGALADYTLD